MASRDQHIADLPTDILSLISQQLLGDSQTLSSLSRVSKAWHCLCLPFLLNRVDLSCHNLGRQSEWETNILLGFQIVEADYADRFRPRNNLVSRQRAFLRLMVDKPELALFVKSLTWTLIWFDFDETALTSIDRQTWNVFQRLTKVTKLDLASLHEIGDEPYVRQNPAVLFPAVTNLRLVGWMHRGLVKAIVESLDASRLRSLKVDHLQDEGALLDGRPMLDDLNLRSARSVRNGGAAGVYDDESIRRQEAGKVCTFPGPMWLPLRMLRNRSVASLEDLSIRLGAFDSQIDLRNYYTMFAETAKLIVRMKESLKSLTIALGESVWLHCTDSDLSRTCGTSRVRLEYTYRPWCFDITTVLLQTILRALTENAYPQLANVYLEGFRIIEGGQSRLRIPPDPAITFGMIDGCPFTDLTSIRKANVDRRQAFTGYDFYLAPEDLEKITEVFDGELIRSA